MSARRRESSNGARSTSKISNAYGATIASCDLSAPHRRLFVERGTRLQGSLSKRLERAREFWREQTKSPSSSTEALSAERRRRQDFESPV
jgi:hypothetical protein